MYVLELEAEAEGPGREQVTYAWHGESDEVLRFRATICAAALGALAIKPDDDGCTSLIYGLPGNRSAYGAASRTLEKLLADPEPFLARRAMDCIGNGTMPSAALLAELELVKGGADALRDDVTYVTTKGFNSTMTSGGMRPWTYDQHELLCTYGQDSLEYRTAVDRGLTAYAYTHERIETPRGARAGSEQHATLGRLEGENFIPVVSVLRGALVPFPST